MAKRGERAGEVEQVLILWENQDPGSDEIVELIQGIEPGLDPVQVRIEKSEPPAISYGLASWHVYQDETAGRLRPGAYRRKRHVLIDDTGRGRRLVTIVYAPTGEVPEQSPARLEWARELLLRHIAVHELDVSPGLMALRAWRRLNAPEVLDFVLNVGEFPDWAALDSGRTVGFSFQTFDDLKVVVSMFDEANPRRIRKQFLEGYRAYLEHVLHELDFGLGTCCMSSTSGSARRTSHTGSCA